MTARQLGVLCAYLLSTLGTASCALLSKSDALAPRYFSPERSHEATRPGVMPAGSRAELRLGRVDGASHLDERLVFRDSDNELGYYSERRWTEAPAEYLKRRLARVLFEERGMRHVIAGSAPTLEVQLTSFEEVRAPKRMARVQVTVRLHDQRLVLWEETLTVDQPVTLADKGDLADAAVEALSKALRVTVDRIADRVVRELSVPPQVAAQPLPGSISDVQTWRPGDR